MADQACSISEAERVAPVFKWPGGKRSLVSAIQPFISRPYRRLVEPFCGGAALFFALRPAEALLADRNPELINAYIQIRDNVEAVIDRLGRMTNSETAYYAVRERRPRTELTRAVRMIYLMQLSFNGIYRENLAGEFNVPYGQKTWLPPCDPERLRSASRALQSVRFEAQSYSDTMRLLRPGDCVYVDPPYTVSHNNNGFIKYNRTLFSWADQKDLASACERALDNGVTVIVSNADHDEIRALYPSFDYHQLGRYCPISGTSEGRRHVTEALFVGTPS
jgi:DNA adenine methylase